MANPIKKTGGLVILKGNLAPEGAVIKVAGYTKNAHTGPGRTRSRTTSSRLSRA